MELVQAVDTLVAKKTNGEKEINGGTIADSNVDLGSWGKLNFDNYKKIEGTMIVFDNVIPEKVREYVLKEILRNSNPTQSQIIGKNPEEIRKSKSISITDNKRLKHIDQILFQIYHQGIQKYIDILNNDLKTYTDALKIEDNRKNSFELNLSIRDDEGYSFLIYEEGGYYNLHHDASPGVDHPSSNRKVSGILYLNDDFKGGETYFPRQKVKVKPRKGGLLLFPSGYTHPHQAMTVSDGEKYVVTTWFK